MKEYTSITIFPEQFTEYMKMYTESGWKPFGTPLGLKSADGTMVWQALYRTVIEPNVVTTLNPKQLEAKESE